MGSKRDIRNALSNINSKAVKQASKADDGSEDTEDYCESDPSEKGPTNPSEKGPTDPSEKGLPDHPNQEPITESDDDDLGSGKGEDYDDDSGVVDPSTVSKTKQGKPGKKEKQEDKTIGSAVDDKDRTVEEHITYLLETYQGGVMPAWEDIDTCVEIKSGGGSTGLTPVEEYIDNELWSQVFKGYGGRSANFMTAVDRIWGVPMSYGLLQAQGTLSGMQKVDPNRCNMLGGRILNANKYPFLRGIVVQGSAQEKKKGYTWEDAFNRIINNKLSKGKVKGTKPVPAVRKRKRVSRGRDVQDLAGSSREHGEQYAGPRRSSLRRKEPTVFFGRTDSAITVSDHDDEPIILSPCSRSGPVVPSRLNDLSDAGNDSGDGGSRHNDGDDDGDNQLVDCVGQELKHQARRTNNFVRTRIEADRSMAVDLVRRIGVVLDKGLKEHADKVDDANLYCQNAAIRYYQIVDQRLHQEVELQVQNSRTKIDDLGRQLLAMKEHRDRLQDELKALKGEMERVVREQGKEDAYRLLLADREELEYYRGVAVRFQK